MHEINAQARRGIKLLLIRQGFLQVLTFAGGVVLARVLDPVEFGLFAIATLLVGFFSLLGDFGLTPSFIQHKAELSEHDLQAGFTLQQILTTIIVAVLYVSAPWLVGFFPLAPPETVWLVRVFAFNLYLASWRAMSVLKLERHLSYNRLAWIEVIEILIYQCVAVTLALTNFGVWSFVWATLLQGVVGTVLVFSAAPWQVRLRFEMKEAKRILRMGVPFQIQNIANQLGTSLIPLFIGKLIGPQALGLLSWASSNGKKPLMLVDIVVRVAFPHISRIQDDRVEVERILVRYLTYLLLPAGLWFAVLFTAGYSLVEWIYTVKWVSAVPTLILYGLATNVLIVGWLVSISLNGIGLVNIPTRVGIFRCIGLLTLGIPLVILIGINGMPLTILIIDILIIPWLVNSLGSGAIRRVLRPIIWILIPVAVSVLFGALARMVPLPLWLNAILISLVVCVTYIEVIWLAGPEWMRKSLIEKFPIQLPRISIRT